MLMPLSQSQIFNVPVSVLRETNPVSWLYKFFPAASGALTPSYCVYGHCVAFTVEFVKGYFGRFVLSCVVKVGRRVTQLFIKPLIDFSLVFNPPRSSNFQAVCF